jgi:chorismate mutase
LRNEEVLLRVKEQRNILHEIHKMKANWIGHILSRNHLLQRVTEGKIQGGIEVTGREERRRRKLLDNLKERRGYSHLKEKLWIALWGELALEETLDLS